MRRFLLLLVGVLFVGCSTSVPTNTPAPTVDVAATVESAVEATRVADRAVNATEDTREEATREAAPVATLVVMTIYVPTPEPYVAAPGTIERGIEELHACLQESREFRSLFVAGIEQEGLSREAADDFARAMLEDEEFFTEAMLDAAEEDPEYASLVSLLGGMAGELCSPVVPPPDYDLEMSDSELEVLLGEFFDCYHSDSEVRSLMEAVAGDETGFGFFGSMMSDRDLFMEVFLLGARQDPDGAEYLAVFDALLEAMCR